jgi:four helix bundle protein
MLAKQLPESERYGLISQMTRAAVGISSNIADGSGRSSDKDFCRFLEMSLGSAYELETQLTAVKLIGLHKEYDIDQLLETLISEEKMITALINNLRK